MEDIDIEIEGELKINPIKYQKVVSKIVGAHNATSGKVYLPRDYVSHKVIILLPKIRVKQ